MKIKKHSQRTARNVLSISQRRRKGYRERKSTFLPKEGRWDKAQRPAGR